MSSFSLNSLKPLLLLSAVSSALLLSACGKPADAPAAAAPASAPAQAAAPADTAAAPAAAPAAEKKDAIDPLAHEGVPGLSDLFSKKKEGGH